MNHGMFLRLLQRAAFVHKGRAFTALFAMVVASAVATAMLNLYADVGAKLQHEFRAYGANLVVTGREGEPLPADALATVDRLLAGRGIAVPFSYAVAHTASGSPIVVAGTDFERAKRLNAWWSVDAWPSADESALVGRRALTVVTGDKTFDLTFSNRTIHLTPAGTLTTGGDEDSRIYISESDFQRWTQLPVSTIEIGASGTTADIDALQTALAKALPAADVKPVRQIVEAEARVLNKTRATVLASTVLIVLTAALCVLATLMAWVLEQRKNFAVMKALGATGRILNGFFAAEAAALGAAGGAAGFFIGVAAAVWIGRANFHMPVSPRFSVFPVVFAISVGVALLAAALPMSLLRRVEPAAILKGE